MRLSRRRALQLLGAGLGAQGCVGSFGSAPPPPRAATLEGRLDAIAKRIVPGGPGPDGIPPIEFPNFVNRASGDRIWKDETAVDALVGPDGIPRAYPRLITVWHEIVNEDIGGTKLTLTYCPLTGSSVVFAGRLADGRETTFGTSGQLYNSNLVMYDRDSASWWPQLLGIAVEGDRKGERLVELPIGITTTYGRWKKRHPDTAVLLPAGARPYGTWPYGDYDSNRSILFPVDARDERFHPKKVVVGVRLGDAALAIAKDELIAKGVANVELAREPLVALADPDLNALRVFKRTVARGTLRFARREAEIVDEQTGSRWDPEGLATAGELAGTRLGQLSAFDVQWFAWFAFYPDTAVVA